MCITYTSHRVAESVYAPPPLPEFRDKLSLYHKVVILLVPTTLLFVRMFMIQEPPPSPSVPPLPRFFYQCTVCTWSRVLVICWILFDRYKSTARLPYKFTKPSVALKRWHTREVSDRMVNCWLPEETRELFGCLMWTVNRCWGCLKAILGELS